MVNSTGSSVKALDLTEQYNGNSYIPTTGSFDASASLGFPAGSGIATETGFCPTGTVNLVSPGHGFQATYTTNWTIPAFAFEGTATGTVTPN